MSTPITPPSAPRARPLSLIRSLMRSEAGGGLLLIAAAAAAMVIANSPA